jgi:hypothetical protein
MTPRIFRRFAEELCLAHLVHRVVEVLKDVELVIFDPALGYIALPSPARFPHVDAGRRCV